MTAAAASPTAVSARYGTRHGVMMVALVALHAIWGVGFADRIDVNDGLGWDGFAYGAIAKNFAGAVGKGAVDRYRMQRILPSGVVHVALRALGQPLDTRHVVLAFAVLDAVLLVAACALWVRAARAMRLSVPATWLGYLGLFGNFAVLRMTYFDPVLTDTSALFLGVAALVLFLESRTLALAGVAALGAFVWPVASLSILPLLAFPRAERASDPERSPHAAARHGAAIAVGVALAAVLLTIVYVLHVRRGRTTVGIGPVVPIVEAWLWPSVIVFGAYVVAAVAYGLPEDGRGAVRRAVGRISFPGVVAGVVALLVPALIVRRFAGPGGELLTPRQFVSFLAILPVVRPFNFLVPHAVYLGPLVLLAAVRWRSVAAHAAGLGVGMIAFLLGTWLISLSSESRQSLFGWPAVVLLVTLVATRERWTGRVTALAGLMAVALSGVWLALEAPTSLADAPIEVHYAGYFSRQGPYMPNDAFTQHLALTAALLVATVLLVRRRGQAAATVAARPSTGVAA